MSQEIQRLFGSLKQNSAQSTVNGGIRSTLLQIKVLGRDSLVAQQITRENLSALRPFFFVYDLEIKYEAYTILANALLLNEHLLSSFDPANYAGTVITDLAGRRSISGQLGNFQDDKTILLLRLLYLFTLKGSKSINGHIMACLNMAFTRINAIERKGIPKCQESSIELLKLLYNLIHNYSHIVVPHFRDRVGSLISVLKMTTENVSTNASIHRHICNILLCSPLEQWHRQSAMVASSILVFLQFLLHNEDVNDTQALSEISLLQVIAAGNDDSEVSNLLQSKLTPTSEDRNQILGQSDSLISLMLKATTNLNLKQSRAIIYGILWKTSHESRYAAGFLSSIGLESIANNSSFSPNVDVNPVTGQFYEKEDAHVKDLETEEEKLKEAERLFVLFERLKLKGVINVTNPVELAIQNGSFFA